MTQNYFVVEFTKMPEAPLREKPAFERQQDALNELAHLVEDCDNRLTLESLNLGQRYIKGRLDICLEIRAGDGSGNFHIILGRPLRELGLGDIGGKVGDSDLLPGLVIEPGNEESLVAVRLQRGSKYQPWLVPDNLEDRLFRFVGLVKITVHVHDEMATSPRSDRQEHSPIDTHLVCAAEGLQIDWYEARMMLVRVVEGVNGIQQDVSSVPVRLEDFDHRFGSVRNLFLFRKGGSKFVSCLPKRKGNISRGVVSFHQDREGRKHLVQWRSQIMQKVADPDVQRCRNGGGDEAPDLNSIRVDVGRDFVNARWIEAGERTCGPVPGKLTGRREVESRDGRQLIDDGGEIIDFGFGPFDLGETLNERPYRFHDRVYHGTSKRPS
jgi:hypothetical protein